VGKEGVPEVTVELLHGDAQRRIAHAGFQPSLFQEP